jgi:hypothetical protein
LKSKNQKQNMVEVENRPWPLVRLGRICGPQAD